MAPFGGGDDAFFDWAVVSPKAPHYSVDAAWGGLIDELKLVVEEAMDAATAERLAAEHPEAIISIQPVWEGPSGGGTAGGGAQTRAWRGAGRRGLKAAGRLATRPNRGR